MRLVARLMTALLVATLILPALGVGSVFAAPADHLAVTVNPGSGPAGTAFDVTVDALDNTDATDAGYAGTVRFTSTDVGPSTILPTDYTFVAGDNGIHTFTGGAMLTTTGGQTITATDLGDGSINGTSTSISITPGPAGSVALSGSQLALTSGGTRIFTANVLDQFGNVRTNDNTAVVTFAQTGGGGTVTGLGTDTASSGVATKTVTGGIAGSVTLQASSGSLTDSNVRTFSVAAGAATQVVLSGSTSDLASGVGRVFTATLKDDAGNTADDNTTMVVFSKLSGSGTLSGTGSSIASSGVALHTITGAGAGTIHLQATSGSLTDSNVLDFSVVAGAISTIVVNPSTATVGAGTDQTYTVEGFDAASNSLGDVTATSTFTIAPNGTCNNAAATCQATTAGVHTVTAHNTGKTDTSTLTVNPSSLDHITISPASSSKGVGVAETYAVTGFDQYNNSLGDVTASSTLTIAPDGTCNDISHTCSSTVSGSHTVTAHDGLLTDAATLTVTPGALDHITISPSTATVGPAVAQAYTAQAFDSFNNSLGSVTSSTTFGIGGGGSCNNTAHTCQALTVGGHTVTGTHLAKTDTATLTITNAAPNAVDDVAPSMLEDAAATPINVRANDTDANGDALTIIAKTNGAHGIVAIDAGALFVTYTPAADWSGTDSFTYTVSDGNTGTDTATVSVTVVAQNDAPSFTTLGDQTVLEDAGPQTVGGFASGSAGPPDEAAQTLTYLIDSNSNSALFLTQPAISPSGDLTFTSAANTNGSATITVHVVDNGPSGGGDVNTSPTQTFQISVTAVDDAPVAVADGPMAAPAGPNAYLVKQGVALTVAAATGVLANDTDIDTVHAVLTAAVDAAPTHGTLTLNPDGSFTYTPFAGMYVGVDQFTYHANDGSSDSNVATVSLYIYVNHFPTAVSDSVTVVSGSGYVALNLLANDNAANPDVGEVLHITSASHPAHGTVVITGGGTGLSYRPTSGFIGHDTFAYTITDGVLSSSASVLVNVPKDTYKPTATAPVQTIGTQTAGTSTVKIHLAWTGADRGYGVSKFELWQSTDGHSYKKVKTTSASSSSATLTVNHVYRFRVRAIDKKGNIGSYAYGPTFKFVRYQESSVIYTSTWLPSNSPVYSSGHARSTSTLGATATLSTTGRTFSWLGVRGTTRGTADIFVDGVLKAHLNLAYTSTQYRRVIYSITFTTSAAHAFRVVYTGPTNRRIDIDAILVLR